MNYAKHTIDERDILAVAKAMQGNLTQGHNVERFEEALADYVGARYAVACSNGTSALWLAYRACGLGAGERVQVPTISFVATANMAEACGADVVFSDTDRWAMLDSVDDSCHAMAPVHMTGTSCDMKRLTEGYRGVVVEDAAHALGGSYNGYKVGSCRYSDACCFSFHASNTCI